MRIIYEKCLHYPKNYIFYFQGYDGVDNAHKLKIDINNAASKDGTFLKVEVHDHYTAWGNRYVDHKCLLNIKHTIILYTNYTFRHYLLEWFWVVIDSGLLKLQKGEIINNKQEYLSKKHTLEEIQRKSLVIQRRRG